MQKLIAITLLASVLPVFADLSVNEAPVNLKAVKPPETSTKASQEETQKAPSPSDKKQAACEAMKKEQEQLAIENSLAEERQKKATAAMREEVTRLKLQKELLTEKLAIEELESKEAQQKILLESELEKTRLTQAAAMAKARAEQLASELKANQIEWQTKTAKLEAEIKELEVGDKRDDYADATPQYLENPMREDGTLVISDRRISLNGLITSSTADHVTTRINYFNNKDAKLPIFIVIDDSPGGSVMSGYRILKAMEGSTAPIYVVVKSFAASMAATITTLAERSYAYPNAVILHHQMSMRLMFANLNLTEQKELYEESQKWWKRLAGPISRKMGISNEEFIKRMYKRSTSGDWSEFADDARKLKWVDHIVARIHETSLVRNPDAKKPTVVRTTTPSTGLQEELDEDGKPVMYLPRINPRDFYFLYNPDNYYRMR